MFEGIGYFLPLVYDVFVSLTHDKVKILIGLPLNETVMCNTFTIVGESTPSVAM